MKLTSFNSLKHLSVLMVISCALTVPAYSSEKPTQSTTSLPSIIIAANTNQADPLTAGQGTERPGASPLELMQNSQVKKELNLSNEQSNQIKKINDKLQQNIKQITAKVNWADLKGDKKKQDELEEQIKNQIQPAREEVAKILKPEQINRFKEIALQVYGFGVLSYDQFSKELNLTSDQETKLNNLRQETFAKVRANLESPTDNSPSSLNKARETNRKRVEQFLKESNTTAMNYLTPAQKAKLESLKGKKFNFDPSQAAPRS